MNDKNNNVKGAGELPDVQLIGLKQAVDEGYRKFLKKRGLENDPKFNYGNSNKLKS